MSGPTNANSLALFATLAPLAVVGSPDYIALAVTVHVGLMQFAIGTLRLGNLANSISPAALRGFMGSATALIALYSLPDLLGLQASPVHQLFALLEQVVAQIVAAVPAAAAVGAVTVAVAVGVRRWRPAAPAMLIGIVAATALAWAFNR